MILKPNMVIAGKKRRSQAVAEKVAEPTLGCLYHTVPPRFPASPSCRAGSPPRSPPCTSTS